MDVVKTIGAFRDLLESVTGWPSAVAFVIVIFLLVCRKQVPVWIELAAQGFSRRRQRTGEDRRLRRLEAQLKAAGSAWWAMKANSEKARPATRTRFDLIQHCLGDPVFIYVPYYDARYEVQPNGAVHDWFGSTRFASVHALMIHYLDPHQMLIAQAMGGDHEPEYMVWVYPYDALVLHKGEVIRHSNPANAFLEPHGE